jgi:hypothetical protein
MMPEMAPEPGFIREQQFCKSLPQSLLFLFDENRKSSLEGTSQRRVSNDRRLNELLDKSKASAVVDGIYHFTCS